MTKSKKRTDRTYPTGKTQTPGEAVRTMTFIQATKAMWESLFAKNKWQPPISVMTGPLKPIRKKPTNRKKRP